MSRERCWDPSSHPRPGLRPWAFWLQSLPSSGTNQVPLWVRGTWPSGGKDLSALLQVWAGQGAPDLTVPSTERTAPWGAGARWGSSWKAS